MSKKSILTRTVVASWERDCIPKVCRDALGQYTRKSIRCNLRTTSGLHELPARQCKQGAVAGDLEYARRDAWASAYSTVAAGAALVAGLGVMAYLKRHGCPD